MPLDPAAIEGRLIALRKMLALALAHLPPDAVTGLLEQETLRSGDEDPAALPGAISTEAGAMAGELAALAEECARLRRP